jgi:hypothetical protein
MSFGGEKRAIKTGLRTKVPFSSPGTPAASWPPPGCLLGAGVAEPTSTGRPRRVPASPGSAWKAGHEFAKESSRLKIGESCF